MAADLHLTADDFNTPLTNAPAKTPVAWSNGAVVTELQFTGTNQTATRLIDLTGFTSAVSVKIRWKANATTGTAQLQARMLAHGVGAGSSVESHAFAAGSNATTTTAANANDINETTIALAALDSATAAKTAVLEIGKIGGTIAVSVNVFEVKVNLT